MVTSRVKRVDFLYQEFSAIFSNITPKPEAPTQILPPVTPTEAFFAPAPKAPQLEEVDDLPFA